MAGFEVGRAAVEVVGESDFLLAGFVLHFSPFIFRQPPVPIHRSWQKMKGGK